MANNLFRSLALVGAIAFVPATTAALAQVDVGAYREIDQFMSVLERVKAEYVEDVDDATLIRGAIDGMLASLDPHSSYLNAEAAQDMRVQTKGEFGGLGIEVTMENELVKVVAPIDDTPAARAGILAGDLIEKIVG
jgi:carboxyl-terminal processing protease